MRPAGQSPKGCGRMERKWNEGIKDKIRVGIREWEEPGVSEGAAAWRRRGAAAGKERRRGAGRPLLACQTDGRTCWWVTDTLVNLPAQQQITARAKVKICFTLLTNGYEFVSSAL